MIKLRKNVKYKIEYETYNNSDFVHYAFRSSKAEADDLAEGLRKLKHVTRTEISLIA